jgi:16S rRNA C967 or C1407 C5-methylase (RsmB/RsmF family)|eukprot:SAG25_NODE_2537_length_1545_cov_1.140387_2_plen_195_part_00
MGKKGKKSRGPRPFPPTNFCLYYEPLARDAEDHAALLAAMQRPLPIAFRAAGDALSAAATGAELAARFGGVAALTALGWRAGAWRLACSRAQLRADPSLAAMHAWLVSRHEVGAVRRQEEASMLSVALLGTQPGERVADLCAAPGSKSSELADRLGPSTRSISPIPPCHPIVYPPLSRSPLPRFGRPASVESRR